MNVKKIKAQIASLVPEKELFAGLDPESLKEICDTLDSIGSSLLTQRQFDTLIRFRIMSPPKVVAM